MQEEITIGQRLLAYFRLAASGFKNGMKQYFSYRTQSAMKILGTVMEVMVWGILGTIIMNYPYLQESLGLYKTPDMLTFMLSGLIINRLIDVALIIDPHFFFAGYTIYHNRPFNIWAVALAQNIDVRLFWRVVDLAIYVVFAAIVFEAQLDFASTAFWTVILLGATFRFGLGLFSSGWSLITRSGQDPINWFYNTTSRLFTGELIPINVLWTLAGIGPFFKALTLVHPKTYVQLLGRQTAVGGAKLGEILPDIWAPFFAAIFFLALGYATLQFGLKRAKSQGTLMWGRT